MRPIPTVKSNCASYLEEDEEIESVISQNNPFDKLDPGDDMYLVKTNKRLILFESKTDRKADKIIDKDSVIRICKRDIFAPGYEEIIIEYAKQKYKTSRKVISGMIVNKDNDFTEEFDVISYDEIDEETLYPNSENKTTKRYKEILGSVIGEEERVVKSVSGRSYYSENKKYWLFFIYFGFMFGMISLGFGVHTISDSLLIDIAAVGLVIMTAFSIYVSYKLHRRWAGEVYIVITTEKILKFRLDDRRAFSVKTFDDVEVVEENLFFSKGVGLKEKDSDKDSMMSRYIVMGSDADEIEK